MKSPFSTDSFEPRFVVEHYNTEALAHAVELWLMSSTWSFDRTSPITHAEQTPACLYVAHPHHTHGVPPLPAPIARGDVAAWIRRWLETAQYPEEPWFDGGEAKGFSAFVNYYGSNLGGPYDCLVVLPKWFEIHK